MMNSVKNFFNTIWNYIKDHKTTVTIAGMSTASIVGAVVLSKRKNEQPALPAPENENAETEIAKEDA